MTYELERKEFESTTFDMTAEEWRGLDASSRHYLAERSRETLKRYQFWLRKIEQENAPPRDKGSVTPRKLSGSLDRWNEAVKNKEFDTRLVPIVEELHIHESELAPFCSVNLRALPTWLALKSGISLEEAAHILYLSAPLFVNPKPA